MKIFYTYSFFVLYILLCHYPSLGQDTFKTPPPFNSDLAYLYIQKQVGFGPRVPNTKSHRLCGAYLKQQLNSLGAQVYVQRFQAKTFDGQTLALQNIIASFYPACSKRILLATHWDTRPWADKDQQRSTQPIEGANDGASGVGVLLAMAQAISEHPPTGVGVDIIFFDGEDYGPPKGTIYTDDEMLYWCLGAQYWAAHPHIPQYKAVYGVLLDMVGAHDATFYREYCSMYYAASVVKKIWTSAQQLGHSRYFIPQDSKGHMLDDHVFVNQIARIPMINIVDHWPEAYSMFKSYHHTHGDNLSLIDPQTLQAVGERLCYM